VKPINWTAEDVREWLKGLKRGAFREYAYGLPGDINGRAIVRMNKAAIAQVLSLLALCLFLCLGLCLSPRVAFASKHFRG
jgi:hypothetical protein